MTHHARELRKSVLKMSFAAQDGNLQSAFSAVDIISAVYRNMVNPNDTSPHRNVFVLSKGQANCVLMAELASKGTIEQTELDSFCHIHSRISMQADRTKFERGVEVSAGSLGHGFPMAVGIAWAKKIKNAYGKVFVLVGDGEMNEGTMWEVALFAASENLNNLVLIIDNNQSIGKMIKIGSFEPKMRAFGFEYVAVDGHNEDELLRAFEMQCDVPLVIDASTTRGYGSLALMSDNSWFHRAPTYDELTALLDEVERYA